MIFARNGPCGFRDSSTIERWFRFTALFFDSILACNVLVPSLGAVDVLIKVTIGTFWHYPELCPWTEHFDLPVGLNKVIEVQALLKRSSVS